MTDPWLVQFEQRRKVRAQHDRSFVVEGETLQVRPAVAPEIGIRYGDMAAKFAAYLTDALAAEKAGEPLPTSSGIDDAEMLDISEATIRACLDPASLSAWERLRSPDNADPLGLFDIYGLASFVLTKVTGLPTVAPADSSNGRTPTAKPSRGASRSRARGARS